MKKIATLASATALAVVSVSADAWWGAPYGPYGVSEEQQQALMKQQIQAREQMVAAYRQMAEQMAARRAQMAERFQQQGKDPMAMGFPGAMDPWDDMGPWGGMDPWGDMGSWDNMGPWGAMDPWGTGSPWGDMSTPEFPSLPGMPSFGQMPKYPEMPEPSAMDMPQPPVPADMQGRYAELDAYRTKVMEESKARHEKAVKEMTERRKEIAANRLAYLHRYSRPFMYPHTRTSRASEKPAFAPQATPAVKVPVAEVASAQAGTPAAEAAPTPATATAPAAPAPAASAPAAPAAPVVPAAPAKDGTVPQG